MAWTIRGTVLLLVFLLRGSAGEYEVQTGFAWTNAVVLCFLWLYPDLTLTSDSVTLQELTSNATDSPTTMLPDHSVSLGWVAVPVLAVVLAVVLILCALWGRWLFLTGETRYWGRVHNEHLQAAGGHTSSATQRQERGSSEETDESVDSDKKGLFSWNL